MTAMWLLPMYLDVVNSLKKESLNEEIFVLYPYYFTKSHFTPLSIGIPDPDLKVLV
jgi:hypothetical protein